MLAGLRSAAKSKIAIPIIVLLAVSFAVWGVNDAFNGGPRDAVATVGPEKVTVEEFARRFQTELQVINQEAGRGVSSQEARAAGLDQQLLGQMLVGAALDAKASDLNLGASDAAISREVTGTEAFQDTVRGEFSRDVYTSALAQVGMTEREYEETLRGDIGRIQVLSAITGALTPPEILARSRQAYRNETRTAEVLVLPAGLAELDAEPDEAELQAVLDRNQQYFTFPELRAISVLWFDLESMQASVEVSDDDVQALYEFRGDSLSTPATRSFWQISTTDEDAAQAAAERLRAGEDPAAVAAALGLPDPIEQQDATREDVVDAALADRIFEGGTEPRVIAAEGALGWAAIQITGGAEGVEPSFEDVADDLRLELAEESATDALYDMIASYEDARGEGRGLEEAAIAIGLAAHAYAPVMSGGRDIDGALYADLAQAPAILTEAFMLSPGQVSDLVETPDGGYAVVRVDRIEPQRVAELDEAREEVAELWRAERRDEVLEQIQADARARLEAGESMADVAAAIGAPARNELSVFRRGETSGAVSGTLNAALFDAAQGELVEGPATSGGRALARVTRVEIEDQPDPALMASMTNELTADLQTQFQTALSNEYPVRTYEDQIDLALGETPE